MTTYYRLKNHPYSNCQVREYPDGLKTFISYTTPVVYITADGWLSVTRFCCCSATTRRQVGWFMREHGNGFTYHDCKRLMGSGMELNIYTAEVREG